MQVRYELKPPGNDTHLKEEVSIVTALQRNDNQVKGNTFDTGDVSVSLFPTASCPLLQQLTSQQSPDHLGHCSILYP